VKSLHRFLLVWLLLLALPLQGIAAAGMQARAPSVAMHVQADGHAAMAAAIDAHDGHCAAMRQAAPRDHSLRHALQHHSLQQDGAQAAGHHGGKAGSCADCCAGAAMAPAALPALVLAPPHFISIPFRAGHVPSVDPALPERPPRTALA
jgi:hypothetical protein